MKTHSSSTITRRVMPAVLGALASIFLVATVTWAVTTINNNIDTAGTLTVSDVSNLAGNAYASSTLQATGDGLFYDQLSAGASTNSPTTTFNVTGSGYFTAGLGVGYATTGDGNLLVNSLGVFNGRLGVNASTSPTVEFGVIGSGYFDTGLGVGEATSTSGLVVEDLGVFQNRLGVNATTSPYAQFGVEGSIAIGGDVGTSTISIDSATASRGACLELKSAGGQWISIYAAGGGVATDTADSATSATISTNSTVGVGAAGETTALIVIQQGRCNGTW